MQFERFARTCLELYHRLEVMSCFGIDKGLYTPLANWFMAHMRISAAEFERRRSMVSPCYIRASFLV